MDQQGLKTTTIDGNGAEFFASPNFNLPLMNSISTPHLL
jgi:hypothetical protein